MNFGSASKQTIKPSKPTPQNSKVTLSSLDQTAPQIYASIILFYSTNSAQDQISSKLKSSLSRALSHFYPFAGRIKLSDSTNDTPHVDCNDEGVEFFEVVVQSDLLSFLLDPQINEFEEFLGIETTDFRWVDDPLLVVQLNMFKENGFALGISVSHLIADGASLALFLNHWSHISQGRHFVGAMYPRFDSAAVFPPQIELAGRPMPDRSSEGTKGNNNSIKRFIFSSKAISMLRENNNDRLINSPSRVEAVSAFVWSCLNRVRGNIGSMMTSVNIRKKMISSPTSTEHTVGNMWIGVVANAENNERFHLEEGIRNAVRIVDEGYVRNREKLQWKQEDICNVSWIFSSWCRMNLYENNFGWGDAVWVGCGIKDMKDVCIMLDAKCEGIEVWLWLQKEDMEKVETDPEFVQYISS